MEVNKLAKASLDDIVFEGRNRAYGAYLLRKIYNKHIALAAFIGISIFILFISFPLIAKFIQGKEEAAPVTQRVITEVDLAPPPALEENTPPPPPPPPDLPPPPPPVRAEVKFTPPVVKRDNEVRETEEVPDVEVLKDIDAGVANVEGVKGAPMDIGSIDGTGVAAVAEVVEEKPYEYVEQMPEFPGGEAEMMKFLSKNIKYPAAAQRAGVEGIVVLSFVVSRTGEISDITVLKNLGSGTDEEAIRVVKTMPKWNAGKQNGRAVPVRFTLPVRYTIK